ncbi:MAG TPA: DUF1688 family protein [Sporichthyaceae bacterium]|jgi:hypothetical protein|nr:DUF1688 family protein [Sporichthyaceae bacterium]
MTDADPGQFGPVPEAVADLRDVATIRRRCAEVLAFVRDGDSKHFTLDEARAPDVVDRIATITAARFPDLAVPHHSRWRHFGDRVPDLSPQARIDLAVVSVLLDAGAGPSWSFFDAFGATLTRSEGLAVASLDAFLVGTFSDDPDDPCRVDSTALLRIDADELGWVFQVGPHNPLVGLDGRAQLLRRLAGALDTPAFGGRPGGLFDTLTGDQITIAARDILRFLLDGLSSIWPSGQSLEVDGHSWPLGDVWDHPTGPVPFHKLSQWLTYSLIEPFEWAGVPVTGLDELTGLPEYRNGGLLLDAGLVVPRAADWASGPVTPADPPVVEWRALTVALLDELAPRVRERLAAGRPEALAERARALPLPCLLEGGSWAAGRAIAAERRPGGAPPVTIISDGTVF